MSVAHITFPTATTVSSCTLKVRRSTSPIAISQPMTSKQIPPRERFLLIASRFSDSTNANEMSCSVRMRGNLRRSAGRDVDMRRDLPERAVAPRSGFGKRCG